MIFYVSRGIMVSREFRHLLNYCTELMITLIIGFSFAYVWFTYCVPVLIAERREFFFWGNYAIIGIYILVAFMLIQWFGGFRIGYYLIGEVCLNQFFALLAANIVGYLLISLAGRYYFDIKLTGMLFLMQIGIIIPVSILSRILYLRLYPAKRIIVVYGYYSPDYLIHTMSQRPDRYCIVEMIRYDMGMEVIQESVKNYDAVLLSDLPSKVRNELLKFCFEHKIQTYVTPKISDIIITGSEPVQLFDTPLYHMNNRGLAKSEQVIKRFMDIVVSFVLLFIMSPILLVIAIIIKSYDGGPVFFKQDRLTYGGRTFTMIKFRSMIEDSEVNGPQLAKEDDDRITPFGRFLRKSHLDELPQIWNIFMGDMSFVGPRPERPEIAREYEVSIPEFRFRLAVKGGITGYAQVYGLYRTTPYDKLKLDLAYIVNYSIWLDIKLVAMTLRVLFDKESAAGVKEHQTTAIRED